MSRRGSTTTASLARSHAITYEYCARPLSSMRSKNTPLLIPCLGSRGRALSLTRFQFIEQAAPGLAVLQQQRGEIELHVLDRKLLAKRRGRGLQLLGIGLRRGVFGDQAVLVGDAERIEER